MDMKGLNGRNGTSSKLPKIYAIIIFFTRYKT